MAANFSTLNPCDDPVGLSTSNIAVDAASVSWSAVTGAHHYNLRYREVGGSWTTATTTNNSVNLTSLNSGTKSRMGSSVIL